jgi:EAL domain-containing protein (putative c-di-GMP-specific phosphodiesterase class I)
MRSGYIGVLCAVAFCLPARAAPADAAFSGSDCAAPAVLRVPAPLDGSGMDQVVDTSASSSCLFTPDQSDAAADAPPGRPLASREHAAAKARATAAAASAAAASTREAQVPHEATQPPPDVAEAPHPEAAADDQADPMSRLLRIGGLALGGAAFLALALACGLFVRARWYSPLATLKRAASRGLRRDEFHLEYQPVFYTRTRQCVGLEVMLRWRNTVHGIRGAEWYMEQLERTVVGDGILGFKFDAAAAELAELDDSASMYVIVDVPGSLLESQASLDRLIRMAKQLTPVCKLVLQFPLDDVAGRLAEIAQLRAAQIRIGVSHVHGVSPALDALAGAGIEFLKADREVMSLEEDERARRLRALASAGKRLAMAVVVDGVEGASQYQAVGRAHIDLTQGFYLGKAIGAARLPAFLEQVRNAKSNEPPRFMHAFQSH